MGPGPWKSTIWRDRTTVLTFGIFGNIATHPQFRISEFDKFLYTCIFGVGIRSRNSCFRTPTIRYLSFGRGVTP